MRKITGLQVLVFLVLLLVAVGCSIATTHWSTMIFPPGDFRGVAIFLAWLVLLYLFAIGVYRSFLALFPLEEGAIDKGSREEFIYHVYLLFNLALFQPLTRSLLIPVPLMRLIYLGLGAKLGDNTYSAGTILDPPLTRIGANSIVGHDAVLFSHAVEGEELSLAAIEIGNNVTIGAKAVIMPGVRIDDDAVVAVSSVVRKGTHVRSGERWGGIPAKLLRRDDPAGTTTPSSGNPIGENMR